MPKTVQNDGKMRAKQWWKDAVIYQIYLRSFSDGNDDGIGDIPGIISRIPYLSSLGVNAIWLTPFYPSPQADNGYDVSNYYDIDAQYGTLNDFDTLIARAHRFNIKIIIDIVANHTSVQHPWFKAALKAPVGSRKRARYLFMDGKGTHNELPPNNWKSWFGGNAWKRVPNDTQWYLHTFSDQQADLNWNNSDVRQEFERILRFWLDRRVDGLRIDAAMCMMKRKSFADTKSTDKDEPLSHQPEVFELYREWRKIIDEYDDRCMIGEVFGDDVQQTLQYVDKGQLHQVFNFDYQSAMWQRADMYYATVPWLQQTSRLGTEPVWVTSSHDQVRHVSRLGLTMPGAAPRGINAATEQPSITLGQQRARAMICMTAFLPGAMCIYYGEELGLPEHTALNDKFRKDPRFQPGRYIGRDGARVPMPWEKNATSFGFSHQRNAWLPQPTYYGDYAVDQQNKKPASMLTLYKQLLTLRRRYRLGHGQLKWLASPRSDVIVLQQNNELVLVINFGHMPITLPISGQLVAKSLSTIADNDKKLPGNAAVWIKLQR